MNLTELQAQLRSVESKISDLTAQIEAMKPRPESERQRMFDNITGLAGRYPLYDRSRDTDEDVKNTYIRCLAYLSLADETGLYERLCYLCRLAYGMGITDSCEEIVKSGMTVDRDFFEQCCLKLGQLKYSLIADAMILANITKDASQTVLSLAADMAEILALSRDEIQMSAYVSKAVLTDNFDPLRDYDFPDKNRAAGLFSHQIPLAWLETQRVFCGEYCVDVHPIEPDQGEQLVKYVLFCLPEELQTFNVKKRLKAGSLVKKEDALVEFEDPITAELRPLWFSRKTTTNNVTAKKRKTIRALCDGTVFFAEKNLQKEIDHVKVNIKSVCVYVVSYFDDYTSFCDWFNKQNTEEK